MFLDDEKAKLSVCFRTSGPDFQQSGKNLVKIGQDFQTVDQKLG